MSCSVEARTSAFPYSCAAKDASYDSDDPDELQELAARFSAQATLSQIKLMTWSKKVPSLIAGTTAEGCIRVSETPTEGMAGTSLDHTSDGGYETPVEELSGMFPDPTTESVSISPVEEARTSTVPEKATSVDDRHQLGSMSFETALAQMKRRDLSGLRSRVDPGPTMEECIRSNSQISYPDESSLNSCSTGGGNDSQKCSTEENCDSQKHSSCTTSVSQRNLPCAISKSQRYLTGTRTSDSQRYSTCATSTSRRHSTCATFDSRRFSTGGREVPAPSSCKKALLCPVSSMRSLLNPSTSMRTFLSLVCTEETLVSTSDSKVLQGALKSKKYSSEVLLRPGLSKRIVTTENLDWSTIPTCPENTAPEDQDQDQYSNSNISWSSPLEVDPLLKVESPRKEEPLPPISERSLDASIPIDHFAIYVGSERKRFLISSEVVTHELFKQLLVSDFYKVEERDGKFAIALLCDIDYFLRLLFFVDQRKRYDQPEIILSSSSKRYDVVAHESKIGVASSSG